MIRLIGMTVIAVSAVAFALVTHAQSPTPPTAPDVNHDGVVNSLDLQQVAQNFGVTFGPNPCVDYRVFDDAHPIPTENGPIINSIGEVQTPRGGIYLVPFEHPQYETIRAGGKPDLWACP